MVGYVRWEEKRKRLTLRRCPLGDGEVCLLEGGGRLDRRVQRRVRQGGAGHGRRRGAVCGGTAGVGGAAASPSAPGPGGAAAGHAGAAGGLRLQAAGTLSVTGQCGAAGLPADGAVTEAADLLARRVRYLSPQLGRGQEELRRSLRHRYGLGEGGPVAQLAVCFGAAAEGLPSLLIGESHQEVRYVWAEPWWEKMKPWAAEEPLLAALLAEGSLPPGAAVPVWVGLDTGGERTYNAE